ncbi:type II CAAX prenyl endopeptidase Rce1 family protein [Aquisalinus flavus]|uniref:Peptidase n=1 Tax=Aquisalinus flavus TaxID=1526572 RepID=A0A8J2Y2X7_9PROT|nr:CPBP family glutamic-type intramembrane protease [Aquisalinus flavus]MBD0426818.1 CPBP family intramembrane metalloprotease [Aquisalinus flavus]UNE46666.1 CPBP family intramembrane metalloprotease [Aquisalinus flavus]GGC96248.1 peptidase [Aquisalinus flavus]
MPGVFQRLAALPDRRGWLLSTLIYFLFAVIAVLFGLETGILAWQPGGSDLLAVALVALVIPSLVEELVFRAPLLWAPRGQAFIWSAVALALFVLWHPLNAWLILPDARPVFFDPRFLIIAGGLGLACTMATVMTRSIVPAILMHWLTVTGWKGLFGGEQVIGA